MTMTNLLLDAEFFRRPATRVARDLLGKVLVRRLESGEIVVAVIHETEAYVGPARSGVPRGPGTHAAQ